MGIQIRMKACDWTMEIKIFERQEKRLCTYDTWFRQLYEHAFRCVLKIDGMEMVFIQMTYVHEMLEQRACGSCFDGHSCKQGWCKQCHRRDNVSHPNEDLYGVMWWPSSWWIEKGRWHALVDTLPWFFQILSDHTAYVSDSTCNYDEMNENSECEPIAAIHSNSELSLIYTNTIYCYWRDWVGVYCHLHTTRLHQKR